MLLGRVDDKFAVNASDVHTGNRSAKGNVADTKCTTRANHAGDFGRVILVEAKNRRDNLNVIAEAVGEERSNRTVNQSAL